jgi:hypothetical protein
MRCDGLDWNGMEWDEDGATGKGKLSALHSMIHILRFSRSSLDALSISCSRVKIKWV